LARVVNCAEACVIPLSAEYAARHPRARKTAAHDLVAFRAAIPRVIFEVKRGEPLYTIAVNSARKGCCVLRVRCRSGEHRQPGQRRRNHVTFCHCFALSRGRLSAFPIVRARIGHNPRNATETPNCLAPFFAPFWASDCKLVAFATIHETDKLTR